MSSARSVAALDPGRSVVEQLRERVAAMERRPAARARRDPARDWPTWCRCTPGATYAVDSASLALALAAGASQAGEWVGFAGCADFGAEAAAELGIELSRTVLVPDPGEHWLEVTAALVDVLRVVVLRPPAAVDERTAGILDSRLRTRSAVLVVHGDWPRVEARLSVEESGWTRPGVRHRSAAGAAGPRRRAPRRAAPAARRPDLAGRAPGRPVRWRPARSGTIRRAG